MIHVVTDATAAPPPTAHGHTTQVRQRAVAQRTPLQPALSVQVAGDSGRIVITVIDRDTDHVIRRLPWDEESRLSYQLQDLKGLAFDKTI